jgi:hypothetical protein
MFNKRNNLTLFQPQLSCYAISSNGQWRVNDINIWGKLYKTKIYKKAVNVLGKERYSYYDVHAEDFLMVHLLLSHDAEGYLLLTIILASEIDCPR